MLAKRSPVIANFICPSTGECQGQEEGVGGLVSKGSRGGLLEGKLGKGNVSKENI